MLTNFFHINLPYGIKKDPQTGGWYAFNREYAPIGFNKQKSDLTEEQKQALAILPVYTQYFEMTNDYLVKVADGCQAAVDANGNIVQIWFYKESPMSYKGKERQSLLKLYFEKLSLLCSLEVMTPEKRKIEALKESLS